MTAPDRTDPSALTRRGLMQAGLAASVVALAGCRTYGATTTAKGPGPAAGSGAAQGAAFAKAADIPIGGGKIFQAQQVVVTHPAAGTFLGFSSVCTHAGCVLASVSGGTMNCDCHGSRFRITDGSVARGPAGQPLPPATITVVGGEIFLG